jgi:hypothetical protein
MIPRQPSSTETQRGNDFLAPSQALRMKLLTFRPLTKNSLRGFAFFELPNGLRIIDCPVLTSHGKAWVLPSRPVLDESGRQKRDINEKPQYAPVVQ